MKTKGLLSIFLVLLAICYLPGLVIRMHDNFISGLSSFLVSVLLFIIILVSIPFIIKLYKWLIHHSFTDIDKEPVLLFALGGLCWILVYYDLGSATIDFHYHDTMYVASTFDIWKYISIFFGICCMIYFVFSVIFGRSLNANLSRIHFWVTYIGLNILVRVWVYASEAGRPRRYVDSGWDWYNRIQIFDKFIFLVLILVVIAQLLFLFNVIFSLSRKRKT